VVRPSACASWNTPETKSGCSSGSPPEQVTPPPLGCKAHGVYSSSTSVQQNMSH
jgi:hypothetical protein